MSVLGDGWIDPYASSVRGLGLCDWAYDCLEDAVTTRWKRSDAGGPGVSFAVCAEHAIMGDEGRIHGGTRYDRFSFALVKAQRSRRR